jgi:hypothetical protein
MATSTGVKYIGKNDVYEDNILRTGLTWSKGETHILPEVMAKEFLKHPGMFAEVPGASYLIASASATGNGMSTPVAGIFAGSSIVAPVFQGIRTIIFGDSLTAYSWSSDTVTEIHPSDGTTYWTGGTFTETLDKGWFSWADYFMGAPHQLVRNAGIGGHNTDQMLARVQADVLDYAPALIYDMCGINDIVQGKTAEYVIANKKACLLYTSDAADELRDV